MRHLELRVLVDILAGASAGGINAIFLADAISTGRSLDPLTDLWLETADVDKLLDPGVSAISRVAKAAAVPIAWALLLPARRAPSTRRSSPLIATRSAPSSPISSARAGSRRRSAARSSPDLCSTRSTRWRRAQAGPPLLPDYQPLDLFVTVTDFHGHPERLRLIRPAEVMETEHRLILSFRDPGGTERSLADPAELAFAARATASFPGAFPPFRVDELDQVLETREQSWPGPRRPSSSAPCRAMPRSATPRARC